MATIDEIKQQAAAVKNATQVGENTAERVGGALSGLADIAKEQEDNIGKKADKETLFTIHKFFENNLNVSETARKLFVHRNTLVYRLEKIKKLTGLDLREFDDAITFKVALMVKKYLTSRGIDS